MIIRFKGYKVKIDNEKWKEKSFKEKITIIKEYILEELEYLRDKFIYFWVGFVDIQVQDILCGGIGSDEPSHTDICYITILVGRFNKGQCFSNIDKPMIEELINDWEFSNNKKFHLHIDLGCGAYQEYVFSRKQKDMLIAKLKPLLDMKWYEN